MPYIDAVTDPDNPVVTLYKHEEAELPLLKKADLGVVNLPFLGLSYESANLIGQQYKYKDLRDHTFRMMHLMMINYEKPVNTPKLEDIPKDIRDKLKPFAYFLAIIDGNAFSGLIDQYIPSVYAFMTFNNNSSIDKSLQEMYDLDY